MKGLLVTTLALLLLGSAYAQSGYQQKNLVTDTPGLGGKVDNQLSNPWGIAIIPGQPVWIANNNSGTSTLYSADGTKDALVVTIPVSANNPCPQGCPTGIVANTTSDFGGAQFIFDTEDGLLVSWIQGTLAFTSVDNSAQGAIYKGLALLNRGSGNLLLAANFHSGRIEVYDRSFHATSLSGNFTDPNLQPGFAPFSVHVIGSSIFVAYAQKDAATEDPVLGPGIGVVDVFDLNGNFVSRLVPNGGLNPLNAPWGVAIAPANFGDFSNDVLIGNFGDGAINAFDRTGNFLGQVKDGAGHPIVNPGLWELSFGVFNDPQTLYFTAGGADEAHGVFGTLVPAASTSGGDFSFSLSQNSITTSLGGSATVSVTASGLNGFNGNIALGCSGLPAGVSCAFSPLTINPANGPNTSALTVSVSQGYSFASVAGSGLSGILIAALALLPISRAGAGRKRIRPAAGIVSLGLVASFLLLQGACGYGNSNHTPRGNNMFSVTATSGSISHSSPVSLTVN